MGTSNDTEWRMFMSEKLFYTYEIYDPVLQMKYIGSRTIGVADPYKDEYMGSSGIPEWNEISKRCSKKIIAVFFSSEEALRHEASLHNLYDVADNPDFFNKIIQKPHFTSAGKKMSEESKRKRIQTINRKKEAEMKLLRMSLITK